MAADRPNDSIGLPDHGPLDDVRTHHTAREYRGLAYPFGEWTPAFGEMVTVAPGVRWLRMPLPLSLDHINLYVLDDDGGVAIVDTGLNSDECLSHWEQLFAGPLAGQRVTRVLVTHFHPDHLGLAGWLCARFEAPLWIARTEFLLAKALILDSQPELPDEVVRFYIRNGWDDAALDSLRALGWGTLRRMISPLPMSTCRLKAGDGIRIGAHVWQVVIGHGHSPEHACLHQPDLELFIAGDQLLPRITSNISVHPSEPTANPLADWFESLDLLSRLPPSTLVLPAHNEPFRGVQVRVEQLRADHRGKLDRLLEHIDAAPRTATECLDVLFKRVMHGHEYYLATGEALAHLNYLERQSMVKTGWRGPAVEYRLAN